MRALGLSLLLAATVCAQAPVISALGIARTITRDRILLQTEGRTAVLFANNETKVWRGKWGTALTAVQPGDRLSVRYRPDSAHPIILELYANITHVWGRITAVASDRFEVDQNYNADPQSGYRRVKRRITFNSDTKFDESAPQDLRVGRDVDIIGLETDANVQATRVTIYEDRAPIRMPAGARVIAPDGSVHK